MPDLRLYWLKTSEVIEGASKENQVQGFKENSKTREIQTVELKSA